MMRLLLALMNEIVFLQLNNRSEKQICDMGKENHSNKTAIVGRLYLKKNTSNVISWIYL